MSFPPYGPPLSPLALSPQTSDLFHLDFRYATIDADAGTITTPSGHVGTFARATTLASVSDAAGTTYTALDGQMAWEQRDWDNDGVRESFGWRTGSSDRLAFPCNLRPMALAGLIEFIETGAVIGTAGATLLALRAADGSGSGFYIDTSGTASGYYRFNYTSGGTTRTATLGTRPVSGDRVQLYWQLASDGAVTFYQSINGGVATSQTSAALAFPATWVASASLRLNSRGTSANPLAGAWYRRVRLVAGALNATTIMERR